jgi:hypothetical protein
MIISSNILMNKQAVAIQKSFRNSKPKVLFEIKNIPNPILPLHNSSNK